MFLPPFISNDPRVEYIRQRRNGATVQEILTQQVAVAAEPMLTQLAPLADNVTTAANQLVQNTVNIDTVAPLQAHLDELRRIIAQLEAVHGRLVSGIQTSRQELKEKKDKINELQSLLKQLTEKLGQLKQLAAADTNKIYQIGQEVITPMVSNAAKRNYQ